MFIEKSWWRSRSSEAGCVSRVESSRRITLISSDLNSLPSRVEGNRPTDTSPPL